MEPRPETRHSSSDFTPINQADVVQATTDYFRSTPEKRDAALIRLQELQDLFASQGGQYNIESLIKDLPEEKQRIIRQVGVDALRMMTEWSNQNSTEGFLDRLRRRLRI